MKLSRVFGIVGILAAAATAQLQPGDIAFTGFNADAPDGLAFVTLKDVPANTRIYFSDANWSGTAFPANEGDWSWASASIVPAGTVIRLDSIGLSGFKSSVGSIVHNNSGGISTSSEAVFAFLPVHPDSLRKPSVFLAALSNNNYSADPGVLTGTGLVQDSTAIRLKPTADIAAYVGPRTGLTQTGYLAALQDSLNWVSQDNAATTDPSDGTAPDLPFSTTAFTFPVVSGDTTKPTVTSVLVTGSTTLEVGFSELVDSATAVNTARYTLSRSVSISVAAYVRASNKVILTHAAFIQDSAYVLQVQGIKDTANNVMAGTYTSSSLVYAGIKPAISFDKAYYSIKENSGSVAIRLNASVAPSDTASVQIQIVTGGTAVAGTDFTFSNTTFTWPKDSAGFRTLSVPLTNNITAQPDRFFVLDLKTPSKATLGTNTRLVVYILDDDTQAPAKSNELGLKFVSSFKVDTSASASAEIVAYDSKSKRLFAMNSTRDRLEILNFRNPAAITKISTVDLLAYGSGGTSVAVKDGLVAVTIDAANFAPGKIVFLDTNGTVLKNVTVGSLPDMVTFSPDGKWALSANEGQPSTDYLTDPEGSVSLVDLSGGIAAVSQSSVTTMTFNAFDAQKTALMAAGVRIFGANNPTVSKDLEPEYITVSDDSKTAWITLQENNAIAKADLVTKTITNLYPLGLKDHSVARNAFDASDVLDSVFMGTWPVKGMYMPDAIANLKVGDSTYLFTANEGDAREYGTFVEEIKVGSSSYKLDSLKFPQAAILKLNNNLGRLAVTSLSGDADNDGDIDTIMAFGARSMSVWNAATGAQVWDGGDELERITAKDSAFSSLFNASNDNATRKNRSDNKGPEPEGITIGKIGSKSYAFLSLERVGGVLAYDVTNPRAPKYVAYANHRTLGSNTGSDLGPEGIIFIPRASSPQDTALIVLANEISATVSVYAVRDTNSTTGVRETVSAGAAAAKFSLHRSGDGSLVFFSRPVDFKLSDVRGRVLRDGKNAAWVDLKGMTMGRYFLTVPQVGSFSLMVTQ